MEQSGYRAWVYDPELEEYVIKEVAKLDFYLDINEVSVVYTLATVQRKPTEFTYDSYNTEDVILIKNTGFKDRNGKHIYTKDILQLPNGSSGVVYWNKDYGSFEVELPRDIPGALTKTIAQGSTVIGNVLKKEK